MAFDPDSYLSEPPATTPSFDPDAFLKERAPGGWRESIPAMVQIESGGNPNSRTGKYSGLLQMGPDEIAKYGDNSLESGTRLLEDRAAELSRKLGREPTGAEVYLAHQQGLGGALAHMQNPNQPAWQSMLSTAEGQQKGEGWAKQAIWGNVPSDVRSQYGSVDNISSGQFADLWRQKLERFQGRTAGSPTPPTIDPRLAPATTGAFNPDEYLKDERRLPAADQTTPDFPMGTPEPPPPSDQGTATAGQALARGYYKTKGMAGGTAEVLGEATGLDPLREFGTGVRQQAEADIKSYPAQAEFLKINQKGLMTADTAANAAQYAKETILDFVPQIGAGILGTTVGGAIGGPPGALLGAIAPSMVMNIGDVQGQLKEKDPNAVAPGWVAAGGTAAAALDSITPFRLGSKLLMRFGKETGEEIAKAALERSAAKNLALGVGAEAGKSAAIEGTTEALQEVIGEFATSGALDRTPDWASLPVRMTESFAAGALGGAVFGGGAHALTGKPALREGGERELPPGPEPPPPPGPTPTPGPLEPEAGPPPPVPPTAPPTPPMGEPPGPGAMPPTPLPVGTWVENVPKGVVHLLGPSEKGPVAARGKPMSPSESLDEGGISPPIAMKAPEGNSVTLYHGTTKAFDQLDPAFATNKYEGATFFSSNPEIANAYAEGEGGRVFRARVNESSLYHPTEAELQAFAEKGDFVQQALEESKKQGKVGVHFDLNGDHIYALHDLAPVTLGSEIATSDRTMTDGTNTTHLDETLRSRPMDTRTLTPAADLTIARMAWQAAVDGKDRISWPMENTAEARALTAAAKRFAAQFPGARVAHSFLTSPSEILPGATVRNNLSTPFLELSQETRDAMLERGTGQESRFLDLGGKVKNVTSFFSGQGVNAPWQVGDVKDARPQIKDASELVWRLARKLGITKPITIIIRPYMKSEPTAMAHVWGLDKNGRYRGGNFIGNAKRSAEEAASYAIELGLNHHTTIEQVYASLAHELGHIVQGEFYFRSSPLLKLQIDAAYKRHVEARDAAGVNSFNPLLMMRDNFIANWFDMRTRPSHREAPGEGRPPGHDTPFSTFSPGQKKYWLGLEEWFAEQVARHFTTSPVVLNAADRFFSRLGKALRTIYDAFRAKFLIPQTPDTWIAQWLDSRLTEMPVVAAANEANQNALAEANSRAMKGIGVSDYPSTDADITSIAGRRVMASVGETPEARAMAAAADRFNGFYKWMLSVVQVAARNLHIQPLQRYVELWQQKQLERAQMMTVAIETLRGWRNLGKKQADNVSAMLDAYMNMDFLSPTEYLANVIRRPTADELNQMQKDHGLNAQARAVFDKVTSDFDTMLLRYEALLRAEARKISDPAALLKRMNEITLQIERMKQIPYAPAMRFGDFVLLIKDQDGNVRSRYHYETEAKRKRGRKDLEGKLLPGEVFQETAIPEQAKPFMGLPPGLLDLIAEKLELSDEQRKTISELKYEYAPAHGFQHRFQRKSRVPGYSMDFMRAYANYFFHGSNYFTNVKYVQALRDEIGLTKLSAEGLGDGTKRIQIHNFMNEHLNYMLDPKPDFAHLRGVMFHWGLGFSPAAAFINLSQMALGSYPFLAGKFGDVKAIAGMTRAGTNLSTFYKRGTLAGLTAARDMRALSEGVKQGIITEAMAPELAGLTEQDNLRKGSFGKASELARLFAEYSSFMFQTTEQVNRRVTFRAAWQLALDNPTAKYVKEMTSKHSLQYESLIQQGWSENEAAAFVVAKDATESTQFIYHQWANPAFMRGKFRTVFMFKNFLQNTMFMLWHYPEARVRSLLVFAFLGGMMGLPGADDMKNIIKAVGWRLFGKDWDPEQEARKLIIDMTSGKINPDLLLHGSSRYGFGMQALMGLMGVPFPTVDLSKSIGLGRLLPADPNTLLGQGASKDPKKALLDSVTQVAGYAFQTNANFYNALTDTQLAWNDAQRWTKAMPRALAGLSKSYQALRGEDPAIRTRTGSAVIKFDTSDSVQLMEALSMAAGFQPQRLTQKWDVIMAQREALEFWQLKREGLLRQAWQGRNSDDKENYTRAIQAIRDYNENLPTEARTKAITADEIRQSFVTRAKGQAMQEAGLSTHLKDIPLIRSIQELYPGADIDVRRTR
jgi:hypothetical protein